MQWGTPHDDTGIWQRLMRKSMRRNGIPMKRKILPLKKYIFYLVGLLGLCILVVSLFGVHSYSSLLTSTLKSSQEVYSEHVQRSTEKNLEDIKNIAYSVAYNQIVQDYMSVTDSEEKFNLYLQVMNLLTNTKAINNSILDIALIGKTGNTANLLGDLNLYQDLFKTIPEYNSSIQFLDKSALLIKETYYDCQIAAIPIYKLTNVSSDFIGVLYLAIDPSTILGDYMSDSSLVPTDLLFANANHQLILGDEALYAQIQKLSPSDKTFTITLGDQSYLCQQFAIKIADGILYTLINQTVFTQKIEDMVFHQLLQLLAIFLLVAVILIGFVTRISNSFHQLTQIMNNISTGTRKALHERITLDTKKQTFLEAYTIANSFNDMMDEITSLNRDIFNSYTKMYELEMSKRKAEIAYLRSQINPHFLYNTLTLICGMASENHTDGVIDITQALSRIYRYSIGDDIVSVRQEMEIIEAYVMIQTTRFENRFTVNYDVADNTMEALIPRMIIQPLVENAVKHGLEKCLRKGTLTIGARRSSEDNTLVIWVYDTGVGISAERLASIRQLLDGSSFPSESEADNPMDSHPDSSIGLYNVNKRINLLYGDPYRLHIDSEENIGTNIQIKIPYSTHIEVQEKRNV